MSSWSSAEEPCAHAWGPDGLPPVVEYYTPPTDIFGNTAASFQPYYHTSSSIGHHQQQQLVVYNYDYSAASQTEHGDQNALAVAEKHDDTLEIEINTPEKDKVLTNLKMHKCPPAIKRALGESYTVPRVVAIGPNYHGREDLAADEVKCDAERQCFPDWGGDRHLAARRVAKNARYLYGNYDEKKAGNVTHMILKDACFLVQFMLTDAGSKSPEETTRMYNFFKSNKSNILHDIMLLENQIPWLVVESVLRLTEHESVDLGVFIAAWSDRLQVGTAQKEPRAFVFYLDTYDPRHFLALVWFFVAGRNSHTIQMHPVEKKKIKAVVTTSVSATQLAEMGINLRANQTAEFDDMGLFYKMGVSSRGIFFAELSMAPLPLDNTRASWLVNMAALELCTTPDFLDTYCEDSTVCSYLRLLCMLVQKEEDVDLLRTEGILQGGAMLTNQEALRLLTNLHSYLRLGCYYGRVMVEIDRHKLMWWIRVYAFGYRHWKKGFAILSAIGAFAGILKTLMSFKGSFHH
ncbi:hypothetical protein HU200_053919 [Digitaria exilis]|uniref:Uncharacterized protein n=1 Tax=Digitaria exilis TaxID=1010633 RepID=A0A835ALU7_9POAL|nr:hypothetical protein HU200_053919 [Digitaria exilis]